MVISDIYSNYVYLSVCHIASLTGGRHRIVTQCVTPSNIIAQLSRKVRIVMIVLDE